MIIKTIKIWGFSFILAGILSANPALEIPQSAFDFGYIPQQAQFSRTFYLKSSGDEAVKIIKVIPGCSCTQAPLDKDIIYPGDSAALEIIFNSKKYVGLVTKRPRVETNTYPPGQRVSFSANVVAAPDSTLPLIIEPWLADFSPQNGPGNTRTLAITNRTNSELEIVVVDKPKDRVKIKLPEKITPGETVNAVFEFDGADKDTELIKSITFQINDPDQSRFSIPIMRQGSRIETELEVESP